jgi:hypothetical protein
VDEAVLDELYSAPLDEFVARRTELAKQLKGEGRADEAAEVAAARKPSVPVWTANQLARRNKPAVKELLEASGELRTAIGKGDREAFGAAQQRQGTALRKLRDAARSLLGDTTDPMLERILSTFREASVDEELRGLLAAGRLTEEPEPGGFDPLAGLTFTPSKPKAAAQRSERGRGERVKRAEAALREAKSEERRLDGEAREAERVAAKARKAADAAAETVRKAEEALAAARR